MFKIELLKNFYFTTEFSRVVVVRLRSLTQSKLGAGATCAEQSRNTFTGASVIVT